MQISKARDFTRLFEIYVLTALGWVVLYVVVLCTATGAQKGKIYMDFVIVVIEKLISLDRF